MARKEEKQKVQIYMYRREVKKNSFLTAKIAEQPSFISQQVLITNK